MQLSPKEKNRYSRHIRLDEIGEAGQLRLKKSKVLVIGAGGLGCPVLLYLTAAGVGHIGIVDFDVVEESNLQRQVLFTTADIGQPKATVAAQRLAARNPHITIKAYRKELSADNAIPLFDQYDIVVDGSDNFATRYLVNDASLLTQTPLVYGSIFKFEGQVGVFNYQGSASYRCLFPEPPNPKEVPSCSEVGVLGVLPGIIGSLQANETLKICLQKGAVLANQLLVYNALEQTTHRLEVERNEELIQQIITEGIQEDYEAFCGMTNEEDVVRDISAADLSETLDQYVFVDVRELFEEPRPEVLAGINIPLPRLMIDYKKIPTDKAVVVVCQKGIRSRIAIDILQKKFEYTNLFNLKGGITAWQRVIKP